MGVEKDFETLREVTTPTPSHDHLPAQDDRSPTLPTRGRVSGDSLTPPPPRLPGSAMLAARSLPPMTSPRIVCIGGAVFDRKYRAKRELIAATSNPVNGFRSHGGVARNVAENLRG